MADDLQTIVKPGNLTNLRNVKIFLGLDTTDADELLDRLIGAASNFIQGQLNRTIASASYTYNANGNGTDTLVLPNYPVTAVASVAIDGRPILPAASATAPGFISDEDGIYLRGYVFTRGVKNITVSYTAGFAEIPANIEDTCIGLVAKKYRYRERIGQVSKILGGETVTFEKSDLTDEMRSVLRNYQKVVPI